MTSGFVRGVVVSHRDPEVFDLRMNFAERFERKVGRVVLGVASAAKRLRLLVKHADDGKDVALAFDVLANGRLIRK